MNAQAIREIYRQFETLGFADMGEQLSQISEEGAFIALSCWSEEQRRFLDAALENEREWESLISRLETLQLLLKGE